jgi:hypothetical protein
VSRDVSERAIEWMCRSSDGMEWKPSRLYNCVEGDLC